MSLCLSVCVQHLWGEQSKLMTSTVCFLPWSHVFGQVRTL